MTTHAAADPVPTTTGQIALDITPAGSRTPLHREGEPHPFGRFGCEHPCRKRCGESQVIGDSDCIESEFLGSAALRAPLASRTGDELFDAEA
ncbi:MULTISPECIES: hypothetical protein [unclassified Streptomyces]|uniref:hypothetical protein n=1 Tax=unclassified Streptomyces TaxID=2593676 RepID=UPI002E289677|nr:hypothetical protein [Streptomyces sp. NBC_00273]